MKTLKNYLEILFELTKIKITSFVTLTTALGFIALDGEINYVLIPTLIGILLLACGSAAMNHYQERNFDLLMDRTKRRPIPSGKISARNALFISILLIISGILILLAWTNVIAVGLGLLNLFWYNVLYTILKRKTPFAIIPGSLVGAIPPAVGWVSAGGSLFDPQIAVISFFFFIWQIPHFWLLLLVLDKDYRQAGFPTLTQIFEKTQLARITFMWTVCTAVTGLLIPLFGIVNQVWIDFGLFLCGAWLTLKAVRLLVETENFSVFRFTFRYINIFALMVVFLISIDKLIF